ncbi:MAG TPA: S41 family peptidase [Pyrinomonadaceae bacterium]
MKYYSPSAPSVSAFARKGLLAVAAVGLFLAVLTPQTLRAQAFDRIERERAQTMLSVIKSELKKNYYDANFRGMDVDARFKVAEEKIKLATTLGQAFGAIAQALLDLNDSHTFFQPPPRPVRVEYGWQMQAIGDECYVSAVKPGSDAQAKGLKPGDLLLSIDGFKPSRKELWKMEYFYYTLSPRPGMRLKVQSPGQQPRELEVAAKVREEKRVLNLWSTIDVNEMIRDSEDSDRLRRHRFQKFGGVVVWKMDSFSFVPEDVETIMGSHIHGNNALILDLRGNSGGYVVTLERLVSHFFDREVKIADLKGRKEMKPQVAKKRGARPFEGKVIVLIDSKSASAAELFARVMQLEKRGVVLGDQSAGAVMQSLGHGMELGVNRVVYYGASITNADVIMMDGKSLEHVGVTPDELLKPSAEDMANMRDPVLARALELAGVRVDSARAGTLFPIEWKK